MNEENKPQPGFEQAAIKKILGGQPYYDEVVREGERSYLRAATLVPAVNQKCILCHPKSKVGDVLGAIGYKIPLNQVDPQKNVVRVSPRPAFRFSERP